MELQQTIRKCLEKQQPKIETGGEEGRRARTAKREKGARGARQVLIHPLTPDRLPQAAPC